MRWFSALIILVLSSSASARPGFYFDLGFGGTDVDGELVALSRITDLGVTGLDALSTDNGDGIAGFARLGFNLLGYGAIEVEVSANSQNPTGETPATGLHGQLGARLYPLWFFQGRLPELLQALEPSVFFGGGLSYQIYRPPAPPGFMAVDLGWRKLGTICFGIGVEYFLASFFKVGLEYNLAYAPMDTFIFNFEDGIRSRIEGPANTFFHNVNLMVGVHWDPFGQPTPFADDATDPTQAAPKTAKPPAVEPSVSTDAAPAASTEAGTEPAASPGIEIEPAVVPESPPAKRDPAPGPSEDFIDI